MKQFKKAIPGLVISLAGILAGLVTYRGGTASDATTGGKTLYALALILALVGILLFVTALLPEQKPVELKTLTAAAMMAALCYIGFAFLKIDIPVPGTMEKTAFHFGNVFCVLGALLLGGLWGGLAGAVGMTLGDLFSAYVTSAPKTFFLKLCIGLITGLVAHTILKLKQEKDQKKLLIKTAVACTCGMGFNVVADPLVGYFYKRYLFGLAQDLAKALAKISAVTTLVNALVAVVAATLLYLALRPALRRLGMLQ